MQPLPSPPIPSRRHHRRLPESSSASPTPRVLRATVFGTPPQDMATLPAKVPLSEINIKLPWRLPVPRILWFDGKLRVWLSAQNKPAPLAIVISGTGSDGNTANFRCCAPRCTGPAITC